VNFRHHNDELVSAHARDGVGFANGGEQALPHSREEDVAVGVAERVVDLFKVVDVNEEDRNLVAVVLRAEDRLAKTLVEQRAISEAGQVIVMGEIVDVIGAAAVLGDVAAGNSDSLAEPDHLDIKPGALDHLVVDEDFTGVGNPGADDLTISMDEAGFDHEGSNFGEYFAVKGFAGHTEPMLGIWIDVAESEVDNSAGGIGDAIEDVEVVQTAFSGGKESRVVRYRECVCLPVPSRRNCLEKSEVLTPEISRKHNQCSALLIRE
jgi:hypothetical protein